MNIFFILWYHSSSARRFLIVMSRHRHFRNLRVEDYLDDDGDEEEYYYSDEDYGEQNYDEPHDEHVHTIYDSAHIHQEQPEDVNSPAQLIDAKDEELLDDIVQHFRSALSDDALTSATVDAALRKVDYDWTAAYELLRARRPTEAPTAKPSSIGALIATDDEEVNSECKSIELPSNITGESLDYENFVADVGTALTTLSFEPVEPFRFDKPSPDDVVRAKQARGSGRSTPVLRLPKPAPTQSRVNVTKSENPLHESTKAPTATKLKPLRLPKLARPLPAPRDKSPPHTESNSQQKRLQKHSKQRSKKVDFSDRLKSDLASIAVVVAGHVDAGKSTLVGHLLQRTVPTRKRNEGDLAWMTDDDAVERERGVTIDIASKLLVRPGQPPRTIALIDAPGHRDFVPAMILGAAQAAAALLIIDVSPGEFEAGLSEQGQTREHAVVLKACGVSSLIVVINKMDVIQYAQKRFESVRKSVDSYLKANGWKGSDVKYIPISGRDGTNLIESPPENHGLRTWYKGPTLLDAIDGLKGPSPSEIKELSQQRTRLVVTDFFKSASLGGKAAVTGRLVAGSIAPKDSLTAVPGNVACTVKTLCINNGQRTTVAISGLDGAPISLGLLDLPDGAVIAPGCVLCDPEEAPLAVVAIRARLLVTGVDAMLLQGSMGILHVAGAAESATIVKICELLGGKKQGASSRAGKKRPPRRLTKGDNAIVEIKVDRPIAIEQADNVKALGRLAFRQEGRTISVGIVLQVLQSVKECDEEKGIFANNQ